MTATLLDGKKLAETMQTEMAQAVAELVQARGIRPGLAAVLVGDNPASQIYVAQQTQSVREGRHCELAARVSGQHHAGRTARPGRAAERRPAVDGILVQLPLPKHIDEAAIIRAVSPLKDVDGFSPESLGLLAAGQPRFLACTPSGVQQLLLRNGIDPAGQHVVIVGRSNIVGKPLALILMQKAAGADATVTVCHSRSRNIGAVTRQADIVVVAIGQARFLKADMVRPGAVVIDVGMNRVDGKLCRRRGLRGRPRGGVGHHAGAGRRRADDDHHAAPEYAQGGTATRKLNPPGRSTNIR